MNPPITVQISLRGGVLSGAQRVRQGEQIVQMEMPAGRCDIVGRTGGAVVERRLWTPDPRRVQSRLAGADDVEPPVVAHVHHLPDRALQLRARHRKDVRRRLGHAAATRAHGPGEVGRQARRRQFVNVW